MQLATQSTSRLSWLTDILILGALFGVCYFLWIGSYPFFTPDEGRYSEVAREMLASGDFITPRVNGVAFLDKPALYYWLQAASMQLFGIKEWTIRFFPALYGIFGCIVTYLAARRLFNRRTGLVSAIILASSPLYFGCSHYANLDLEVAVLITTSLLSFLVAAESQGKAQFILFVIAYVFAGLAFLTKGLIGIAFPTMIGGLWILMLWRWNLLRHMRLGLGIVIVAAITLPWFIMVQRANPEFLHFFFVTQQVTRFLSAAEFNNPSPIWFYLPVIIAGFLPWTAFLPQTLTQHVRRCWHHRHEQAAVLYLLIWALVIFVFFSIPRSKTISYILPVFPPLAILVGKYIADNWQESQRSINLTMCVLQVIFINLLIAALIFALPSLWVDLPLPFTPTLLAAGSELLVSALLLTFMLKRIRVAQLFYICSLTSALMLLTFAAGARHLNMNSAKPLVTTLQTILQPTDTVANYFKFYQDVPLYLNRKIILIADWNAPNIEQRDNWVRELWYSMPFQNTDDILLNEDSFWKRWHSSERIFVFVNKNYLEQFASHTKKFYQIGQHQDILLLCNQRVRN